MDISHDDAVAILKATSERVVLRVEKNAISRSSQPVSTDEDEVKFIYVVYIYMYTVNCYTETIIVMQFVLCESI